MRRVLLASILAFGVTAAVAQPAPQQPADPAFMQAAIEELQQQRNQAMDGQAALLARLKTVSADLAKAQARVKELEPKTPAAPPPAK